MRKGHIGIDELWIAEGKRSARTREILHTAKERGIPTRFKPTPILDKYLPNTTHQGIVALTDGFSYVDLDTLADMSLKASEPALIVAADHITDEGNLGALIRTAAFFSTHGLVLPKDRSAGVTERVRKRSSGAYAHLPVARVVNLGRALDTLNSKGFWIIGTACETPETIFQFDWNRNVVLILGSEARGLSPSIRKRCHQIVSIPSSGPVEALNVSVAAGVTLSEIVRQRNFAKKG
ncbi:MAG: 23S rRNA (guanosine(2251)-2'-O)-methyltransferase RlmB [Deltaproteobacteria bacterium]|nr:23S rRNA (guanosine(2251)-2'-O)-methyltransferase RlmB [Deltaproteobacteria bacterium]